MRSLRTKFTLILSFLIIIILGGNSFFVITQKTNEIAADVFRNALSYAQLVSRDVVLEYQDVEQSGAFLQLPTKVKNLLDLNYDIQNIQLVTYDGDILFDFSQEKQQRYDGTDRKVDEKLLEMVQYSIPSVESQLGEAAYIEVEESGEVRFIQRDGSKHVTFLQSTLLDYLVFPVTLDKTYALVYQIRYDTLRQRVYDTSIASLVFTGASILVAIIIAFIFTSGIVRPLRKLSITANDIAHGNFGKTVSIRSKDEVGRLGSSFNKMSIELKDALDQLEEKAALSKEIELASNIQKQLLPKNYEKLAGLDIHAGVTSAEAVGGDLYDFIKVDKDRMLFYIGDVTGHGVSASLVTAIANSIIYGASLQGKDLDVHELSVMLNKVVFAKTRVDMFITAFIGLWDDAKGTLSFTPCGHEPTYLFKRKSGTVEQLAKEGIALGMLADVEKILKPGSFKVTSGDVLILYSDGIPEARNPQNELYGFERLEASIKKNGVKDSAKEIYEGIINDVFQFMNGAAQLDDITLIVLKK